MAKYVILLRGMNTGNLRVKMTELKAKFRLIYPQAETVSATGNLLVETEDEIPQIREKVRLFFQTEYKADISCIIRSEQELQKVLAESETAPERYHHYVLFPEADIFPELKAQFEEANQDVHAKLYQISYDIHWIVRKGETLEGFGKTALGQKKYKEILTSRNLNTVEKIAEKFHKM